MTIVKTPIEFDQAGRPIRHHYHTGLHAVVTGPIRGTVTLADGTVVDVREDVVEAATPEQAAEIAHLIGLRYAAEGHPHHEPGDPFVYTAPEGN